MAIKKRSWFGQHIITHHHMIADRLVRAAFVFLIVILAVGFFITRWQNTRVKITTTITGADTAVMKDSQDFFVDVVNAGARIRGGVQLVIRSSPGIRIETVDDEVYPLDGVFVTGMMPPGAQTRFKVHANITALGSQEIVAEVRRTTSDKIIAHATHVVVVDKPELRVAVAARYYSKEGEQLGRGPLPPKVGELTTYYVTMQIPYEEHAWNMIEVSGTLGPRAKWTGVVLEGGTEIQYDPVSRQVIWRMDTWPTSANEFMRDAGVSFMVGVTPIVEDTGKTVPLLGGIQVRGITAEGERFVADLPMVTTDTKDDAKNQDKCLVEP